MHEHLISCLVQFQQLLKTHPNIYGDADTDLVPTAEKVKAQLARLTEDAFSLSVMADGNNGKSTLLNCLLRMDLFPTSAAPCTAAMVSAKYCPKYIADVWMQDGSNKHFEADDDESLRMLYGSYVDMTPRAKYGVGGVKCVNLKVPSQFLQELRISVVDLPGLNQTEENMVQFEEHALNQSFFLMVFNVQTGPTLSMTRQLNALKQHLGAADVFIVVNKMDTLMANPRAASQIDDVKRGFTDEVGKILPHARIHFISALNAFDAISRKESVPPEFGEMVAHLTSTIQNYRCEIVAAPILKLLQQWIDCTKGYLRASVLASSKGSYESMIAEMTRINDKVKRTLAETKTNLGTVTTKFTLESKGRIVDLLKRYHTTTMAHINEMHLPEELGKISVKSREEREEFAKATTAYFKEVLHQRFQTFLTDEYHPLLIELHTQLSAQLEHTIEEIQNDFNAFADITKSGYSAPKKIESLQLKPQDFFIFGPKRVFALAMLGGGLFGAAAVMLAPVCLPAGVLAGLVGLVGMGAGVVMNDETRIRGMLFEKARASISQSVNETLQSDEFKMKMIANMNEVLGKLRDKYQRHVTEAQEQLRVHLEKMRAGNGKFVQNQEMYQGIFNTIEIIEKEVELATADLKSM